MARTAFSILCTKRPTMNGQILVASLWLATIIASLAVASWTATCKQRNINTHKLYWFLFNITPHSDNTRFSKGLPCVMKCARQTNGDADVQVSSLLTRYYYHHHMSTVRLIPNIFSTRNNMLTYEIKCDFTCASYENSAL